MIKNSNLTSPPTGEADELFPSMATGEAHGHKQGAAQARARLSSIRNFPPELRKEILLTHAAVERIELAQGWKDIKQAAKPARWAGSMLAAIVRQPNLGRAVDAAKHYPYLSSVASIALGLIGKVAPKGAIWRVARLMVGAGMTWWVARRAAQAADILPVERASRYGDS